MICSEWFRNCPGAFQDFQGFAQDLFRISKELFGMCSGVVLDLAKAS
jgi:hypothetical protein